MLIPESVADEWGLKKRPYLQALDIIRPKTEAGILESKSCKKPVTLIKLGGSVYHQQRGADDGPQAGVEPVSC